MQPYSNIIAIMRKHNLAWVIKMINNKREVDINPLSAKHIWWNLLFLDFSASVDIRPLPDPWIVELLGVVFGVQDHKKIKFPMVSILANGT